MAFTFSDLNKLNIDSLADVISLTLGLEGELSNGVTVLAGIEKGKPILTFTATDKAVRRSAGCDSEYKYSSLNDKVKYYDHAQIELPIVVCLQDLWGKMVAKGVHLSADFDQTQLAAFMQNEILKVLESGNDIPLDRDTSLPYCSSITVSGGMRTKVITLNIKTGKYSVKAK